MMNIVTEWVEDNDEEEIINACVDRKVDFLETEDVFSVENDEKSDVNMENIEKEKLELFRS